MKKIIYSISTLAFIILVSNIFTSCADFFDPNTDDELNGKDYISSNTEMYTGFLGIITKVQEIGDKEILLTDTRGELLEPTDNSNKQLIALYDYDTDLQNNSYADPSGYYEVIIACNDYLAKMKAYKKEPGVDETVYDNLVASTARIKVWIYKTLGEIYGKAVWFDDPITKITSIADSTNFKVMDMPQLIDKCLSVMDNGIDGITLDRNIDWIAWLDPGNVTSIAKSQYRKWNYMVPPFNGLYAELCLWKGASLDAQKQDATVYYQKAADLLLASLNTYINNESYSGNSPYWLPTATTPGHYRSYWDYEQPYAAETISAIIYDYSKNQTNTLLKHFSNEYPNKYWLRPSQIGMNRFSDNDFNPGASGDRTTRARCLFGMNNGSYYIAKYRPTGSSYRANAYQDDVHIYIYRATQYHMMLAEALNHLKRFKAMNAVLNSGVKTADFSPTDPEWKGFTQNWTSSAEWGTRKYPSMGIRGCLNLAARPVKTNTDELGDNLTIKYNDMAILNETMLEFACEGKVYPVMNRMAMRYKDPSIVADRVCPKYQGTGREGDIRSKIMAGGYWVPFDLKLK